MSTYYNFSQCIICRSKENLKNYTGEFEVTMLLNSLYFNMMFALEKRSVLSVKPQKIARFLKENSIINEHNNEFVDEDIVRFLRNALAHFNIEVTNDPYGKRIDKIKLWAQNSSNKTACNNPCSQKYCIPKQYNANSAGEICTFTFTIDQLRECANIVTNLALPDDSGFCNQCKYNPNNKK